MRPVIEVKGGREAMAPKASRGAKPSREGAGAREAGGKRGAASSSAARKKPKTDDEHEEPPPQLDDELGDDPALDQPPIVIHFGSTSLRIGLATSELPLVMPSCIAWKSSSAATARKHELEHQQLELLDEVVQPIARALRIGVALLGDASASEVGVRADCSKEAVSAAAAEWAVLQQEDEPFATHAPPLEDGRVAAVNVNGDVRTLVGAAAEAAARADPAGWVLFYPFRRGALCRRASPGVLRAALETILRSAIVGGCGVGGLGVHTSALADSCAVLALPDGFPRRDGSELLDVLLGDIGMRAAIVQEAATLACIGARLASACVVHVGASRTAVACIDELMPLPGCR